MELHHAFESIPRHVRGMLFWSVLALTLVLAWSFLVLGPRGLVELELTGNVVGAARIIARWRMQGALPAAFVSMGLDFLFLLAYSTTIALACVWAAENVRGNGWPLWQVGILLAWGQWLAALLDAVENIAMLKMMVSAVASPWPQVARYCALPKFALVILGVIYVVVGVVACFAPPVKPRP